MSRGNSSFGQRGPETKSVSNYDVGRFSGRHSALETKTRGTLKFVLTVAISALAAFLWASGSLGTLFSPPPLSEEEVAMRAEAHRDWKCSGNETAAYIMTQKYVRSRLRSPSTASFPWAHDIRVRYLRGCRYQIAGYVDAQNGFGAVTRLYYAAELGLEPSEERWNLASLEFIE